MEKNQSTQERYSFDEYNKFFQDRIQGTFTDYLGMELLKYEPGYSYTRIKVRPEFMNPNGGLHGGLMFTIADTTAGITSVHLGTNNTVTTVDSHIQFLRPALDLDYLYAEGRMTKDGKRMVFTDVLLLTEEGTVLAKASFIFARIHIPGLSYLKHNNEE